MSKILLPLIAVMILTLVTPSSGFTQMPNMHGWHAKYWFYRWRLRNDFMVMGEEAGQSLVAEQRNPNRNEYMKWSDAMIMHGYYLTMLAIEHKILQDKGRSEDLKNNERELYYAVKAFERVDYNSETFYSSDGDKQDEDVFRTGDNTLAPDVNGYFHRDDVPPDFINKNQWHETPPILPDFTSNYYKLTSKKTGIDYGADLKYNRSAYSTLWADKIPNEESSPPLLDTREFPIVNYKNGEENYYGFGEESVDQVIRLLLGFFTIVKSIEDISYGIDLNKDGVDDVNMNFQQEAKRHSTNIIGRLAGHFSGTMGHGNSTENEFWLYPSLLIPDGDAFWTIINPRGNEVSEGSAIVNYMPPIQKVSKDLFTSNNDLGIGSQNYAAWPSSIVYNSLWGSGALGYQSVGNVKMSLILNTISNSGSGYLPVGRFIYNKSSNHDYQALYTPLYDYLWGWDPDGENDQNKKAQAYQYANLMLDMAPCVGPHNFGADSNPFSPHQDPDGVPIYWKVPFIFDNDHSDWDDNNSSEGPQGWFSGVDYMLLYNLIYANNDGEKPLYHDLINRVVNYDINTDLYSDRYGYSAEGLMIGAFENLKVKGNIYGNTPVTLKALEYVQLDEGIYDPNNMPDGITIEVGKITCGNDFTSQNTPYSIDQCTTCDLEHQLGSFMAPKSKGQIFSHIIERTELNELNGETVTDKSNILVFPNPTVDYFLIEGQFQELMILDQNGYELIRFDIQERLFDIRSLSSGIYTLIIKLNEHETKHIKLVKI